jgi:endogenous inhibitor of DNA gyrase (YacG/DUF329 family)
MSEPKKFECPSCGVDTWLYPDTLEVKHDEPACAAWQAAQNAPSGVVRVSEAIAGGALPSNVMFDCPECQQPVRMRPLEQPISVEHSLPPCEAWRKIEGKRDDLERYLIKAGAHIHVPVRD